MSALGKAGVTFTNSQKKQIKALVKSGNLLGAQKIILAELGKEFGGSAEASATAGGRLEVAFHSIQDEIGGALLPVVETVATWLGEHLPDAIDTLTGWSSTWPLTPSSCSLARSRARALTSATFRG
jgi:hypothetical protein